jgi:hypothetical protein
VRKETTAIHEIDIHLQDNARLALDDTVAMMNPVLLTPRFELVTRELCAAIGDEVLALLWLLPSHC